MRKVRLLDIMLRYISNDFSVTRANNKRLPHNAQVGLFGNYWCRWDEAEGEVVGEVVVVVEECLYQCKNDLKRHAQAIFRGLASTAPCQLTLPFITI